MGRTRESRRRRTTLLEPGAAAGNALAVLPRLARAALLAWAALSVACSHEPPLSDPADGGRARENARNGSTDASVTEPLTLRQHFCRWLFECPSANDDQIYLALTLGSKARCEQTYFEDDGAYLEQLQSLLDTPLPAGAATCSEPEQLRAGRLQVDDPCHIHDECAPGLYCDTRRQCPGACAPQLSEGQPCGSDIQCESRSCNEDDRCEPVSAATFVAEGETCVIQDDAGEVVEWRGCARGTYCEPWETLRCQRPPALGEACMEFDQPCEQGAACHEQLGVCVPARVVPVGEPCGILEDRVALCDVFAGEFCDEQSERCEKPAPGRAGERCLWADHRDSCGEGLYCDFNTGTCVALLPAGAECGATPCRFGCDESASPPICRAAYCDAVQTR